MTIETTTRRKYTEEFKREAVALVTEQGYKIAEAARSLDIGVNVLSRWRRQFAEEASGARLSVDEREEWKRLRKENRNLRLEKEILKKAAVDSMSHCNTLYSLLNLEGVSDGTDGSPWSFCGAERGVVGTLEAR